jgi:hypothetical protein
VRPVRSACPFPVFSPSPVYSPPSSVVVYTQGREYYTTRCGWLDHSVLSQPQCTGCILGLVVGLSTWTGQAHLTTWTGQAYLTTWTGQAYLTTWTGQAHLTFWTGQAHLDWSSQLDHLDWSSLLDHFVLSQPQCAGSILG